MELLTALDLASTFVFALVGARIAADKGLDYGGIAFIAAVASVSGGTLRNIFLGLKPVWISDPYITIAVISAVVITLVFRRVTRIGKTLLVMDTFGLAIATISGAQLAITEQVSWLASVILGVITAVTGGLLRDVLCQVEPVLLHRETIGTSSLIGAITFVSLNQFEIDQSLSAVIGASMVIFTRFISIYFDLHLPKFNNSKNRNNRHVWQKFKEGRIAKW